MFEVGTWNLEYQPEVGVIARSNELDESDVAISVPAQAVRAINRDEGDKGDKNLFL